MLICDVVSSEFYLSLKWNEAKNEWETVSILLALIAFCFETKRQDWFFFPSKEDG